MSRPASKWTHSAGSATVSSQRKMLSGKFWVKGDLAFKAWNKLGLYPLSKAVDPPAKSDLVVAGKKPFDSDWPNYYEAWSLIHEAMQSDNIHANKIFERIKL